MYCTKKKRAHCLWALLFCVLSRFISNIFIVLSDIESYFKLNSCFFSSLPLWVCLWAAIACFNYWHDYYYYHFIGILNNVRHTNLRNHKPTDTHSFRNDFLLLLKKSLFKKLCMRKWNRNEMIITFVCVCVRVTKSSCKIFFRKNDPKLFDLDCVIHKKTRQTFLGTCFIT